MRIESYGKVYQFGHRHAARVLDGLVTVQEKVDGSQLSWMVDDEGVLHARSKGVAIDVADPPKLFGPALEHLRSVTHAMVTGRVHRGEAVCSRRHNQLKYDRVPDGCVVLFDAFDGPIAAPAFVLALAEYLRMSAVPTYAENVVLTPDELEGYLGRESFLGGCIAEGVVVKNYRVPCPVEGTYPLKAKLVRQELKPAVREQLYRDVYAEMSAHDWDTECEAMDIDPIFDNLMFELHPGWSEDDDA